MKFWEAMKALEEGKRVRKADWEHTVWIARGSCSCGGDDCALFYMREGMYSNDWIEVKEAMTLEEMIELAKSSGCGGVWYSEKGPINISKDGVMTPVKLKPLPVHQPKE